jgi:hypothetical protein
MAKAGVFRKKIPSILALFEGYAPHEIEDLARALDTMASRKRRAGARTFKKRKKPAPEIVVAQPVQEEENPAIAQLVGPPEIPVEQLRALQERWKGYR